MMATISACSVQLLLGKTLLVPNPRRVPPRKMAAAKGPPVFSATFVADSWITKDIFS
eukprot:CAMPEP_0194339326 /NCGR_PEP_ID=MMETSP0171-20130528/82692_1 /TAXON_ID=218684 /ORGANISM="Corethron pennatum, Strain L29A3" /LENGTH=56 /DNA_ID=CAMNT_0039103833 /DNA_START=221 /DNA_END=387 /DNA_ORIENTATION=+